MPTLTSDGRNYLLAWGDYCSNTYYRIYGTVVQSDGLPFDSSGVPLADSGFNQYFPALAWDGSHYLCVWGDERNYPDSSDIYATFVDTLGRPVGVELPLTRPLTHLSNPTLSALPNPFTSFATIPGQSSERFALYDISGRKVGVYKGNKVGWDVSPGIYFLRPDTRNSLPDPRVLRIVKLR
jgi:hypothetical protein